MNRDEIIFGSICRASRAWLGWSQTKFGKKINKSPSSISIIEQGKNCSNLEMYVNILSIFEKAGIKVNKTKGKITLTITLDAEEIT